MKSLRHRLLFWPVLFSSVFFLTATAHAASIIEGLTTITGTAERMISYRHQERFVFTDDGSQHLLVNLGNRDSENQAALALMVKESGDLGWKETIDLECSDHESTADLLIHDNYLHIVHSCGKELWYSRLTYDPHLFTWWNLKKRRIFKSFTQTPSAPTLAVDNDQTFHVAFTLTGRTNKVQLTGLSSEKPLRSWDDAGVWGSKNRRPAKAGRLLNLDTGIALIYTDVSSGDDSQSTLNFTRATSGGNWTVPVVLEATPAGFHDPYGSHYSASVDEQGNIHLIWPVDKHLKYYRYDATTEQWNSSFVLENPHNAVYSQVSLHTDGRVFLIFNIGEQLQVIESDDYGLTYTSTVILIHPLLGEGYDWAQPRVETPAIFSDRLPVLQQLSTVPTAELGSVERLYLFSVAP
ncbi:MULTISPECIES: hypothetical protein [unclassified Neptuniibacter]|uniref:hypothetical protein n=1 Tax=unclassified Neptuniibacter TaxID=2630693 RepID=UPI0025E81D6C|nr:MULTISPECIES: hypothetical protein [unclassified Neptuniibacter]